MLSRICGLGFVCLALIAGITPGQEKKEPVKDGDKGGKEIVGKIKEVDTKKKSFVITLEDKSDRTFTVSKETKFTGPRGSDREDGLRDECMGKGYEVRVVPAADEKVAKEVKLSAW